jgi:hypothetical protein
MFLVSFSQCTLILALSHTVCTPTALLRMTAVCCCGAVTVLAALAAAVLLAAVAV